MTSATDLACSYWLTALSEPVGLGLVVSDPGKARGQLAAAKRKLIEKGVTGLDLFNVRTSPVQPACEIWIMRTTPGTAIPAPSPDSATPEEPNARTPPVTGI